MSDKPNTTTQEDADKIARAIADEAERRDPEKRITAGKQAISVMLRKDRLDKKNKGISNFFQKLNVPQDAEQPELEPEENAAAKALKEIAQAKEEAVLKS